MSPLYCQIRLAYQNPALLFNYRLLEKSISCYCKKLHLLHLIRIPWIRIGFKKLDTDLWRPVRVRDETMKVECWPWRSTWKHGDVDGGVNHKCCLMSLLSPHKSTVTFAQGSFTRWFLDVTVKQRTTLWHMPYLYSTMPRATRKRPVLRLQPILDHRLCAGTDIQRWTKPVLAWRSSQCRVSGHSTEPGLDSYLFCQVYI